MPHMSRVAPGLLVPLIVFLAIALLPAAGRVPVQSSGGTRGQDINGLAWLAGSWRTGPGRVQIEEHWTPVAGGTLFAVSRTIAGDRTVSYEYLRIEARTDGLYYVASPKGQATTDFKLTSLVGETAIFENAAHDFPQRITYRKNADGSLTARIEGDKAGNRLPQEFHFHPVTAK